MVNLPYGFSPVNAYKDIMGQAVSTVGTVANLPEFGISEKINGGGDTFNPVLGSVVQAPTNQFPNWGTGTGGGNDSSAQESGALAAGAGGGGGGYSADDLNYLNDQESILRQMLNRTGTTLNQGLEGLNSASIAEENKAKLSRERAMTDYNTKRGDTELAKDKAIGNVNTNARTMADSVRRRLSMASGSGSSAYQLAAPNAVARDASKNRSNVLEGYGANARDLSTAEKRATEDFDMMLQDLAQQRRDKEAALRSGVMENQNAVEEQLANIAAEKAKLLGGGYGSARIAQQPLRDSINARTAQIDELFNQFKAPTPPTTD